MSRETNGLNLPLPLCQFLERAMANLEHERKKTRTCANVRHSMHLAGTEIEWKMKNFRFSTEMSGLGREQKWSRGNAINVSTIFVMLCGLLS